jgi:hypothetical protein
MVAGMADCTCVVAADWIWPASDEPLQPSRIRASAAAAFGVRDIENAVERIVRIPKIQFFLIHHFI